MPKPKRLQSLDVFRGATIAFMILVNTAGSWSHVYPPLRHADWHGCTPTDLVFPFFLFIVGVSIWFSFKSYSSSSRNKMIIKILKRTSIIFLIGFALYAYPFYNKNVSELRIMGVLQRIALAYGPAALLIVFIRDLKKIAGVALLILVGYWALLVMGATGDPFALTTNVVRSFDRWLLGDSHLYQGKGMPFDPEGVLSTIPGIAQVLLGYLCGAWIDKTEDKHLLVRTMWFLGLVAVGIAWLWGLTFPINKSLWTSSYVIYTTGLALIVLSICIWLIDLKGIKAWAWPFLVFGSNSIFAYVLSFLISSTMQVISITNSAGEKTNLYHYVYSEWWVPVAGEMNGSLAFALMVVVICWLLTYLLYRKDIFVKI